MLLLSLHSVSCVCMSVCVMCEDDVVRYLTQWMFQKICVTPSIVIDSQQKSATVGRIDRINRYVLSIQLAIWLPTFALTDVYDYQMSKNCVYHQIFCGIFISCAQMSTTKNYLIFVTKLWSKLLWNIQDHYTYNI